MAAVGYIVGGLLAGVIALMLISRVLVAVSIRRHQGKPAPAVGGARGKQIEEGRPALFYFFSPSCGACRSMTPIIDEWARRDGRVHAVDISREMDTARKFGVMATPTTILVVKGVVQKILIGPQPQGTLEQMMRAS